MDSLPSGTRLKNRNSQYEIKDELGQGGFGIVYLACVVIEHITASFENDILNTVVGDTVAIKELYYKKLCHRTKTGEIKIADPDKQGEFIKLVNKLVQEGNTLRTLKHPNIVPIIDVFKQNGTAYMVMKYVPGESLKILVKNLKQLPLPKAIRYIKQVLDALEYIHQRRVAHLDINPSNILIETKNDNAVLIDFGSSLTFDDNGEVNNETSQLVSGFTRYYCPSEQQNINNLKQFDPTFDTYAVGATLYNLLTGRIPPASGDVSAGREDLEAPSSFAPGISDHIDAVVLKAMSPKYKDRFQTAAAFTSKLAQESRDQSTFSAFKKKDNPDEPFRDQRKNSQQEKTASVYEKEAKTDIPESTVLNKEASMGAGKIWKMSLIAIPTASLAFYLVLFFYTWKINHMTELIWWLSWVPNSALFFYYIPLSVSEKRTTKFIGWALITVNFTLIMIFFVLLLQSADQKYENTVTTQDSTLQTHPDTTDHTLTNTNTIPADTLNQIHAFSDAGVIPNVGLIQTLLNRIKSAPASQQELPYIKSFVGQAKEQHYH